MSNETLFFVLGSVLVVAALGISFVGLRSKEFPPRSALLAAIGLFSIACTMALPNRERSGLEERPVEGGTMKKDRTTAA